jgi:hypothetical protein
VQQINGILNEIFYEGAFIFITAGAHLQYTLRGLPRVSAHAGAGSSAGRKRHGCGIGMDPAAFYQFFSHHRLSHQCHPQESCWGAGMADHHQYIVLYRTSFNPNRFCLMIHSILKDKPTKLFLGITAFFVANALIAECIGVKIFSLEKVFG